jgi:hypothetical protein
MPGPTVIFTNEFVFYTHLHNFFRILNFVPTSARRVKGSNSFPSPSIAPKKFLEKGLVASGAAAGVGRGQFPLMKCCLETA